MKKHFSTILLILIFLVGLSVLLYPTVSNYVNVKNQSRVVSDYEKAVKEADTSVFDNAFSLADEYNRKLFEIDSPFYNYKKINGYNGCLDITGNGIIAYVEIPKIAVKLPIYEGTSEAILNVAVGQLEGSSLPVGGVNTHSVLSSHRGLPSAKLFTNLDKLVLGDIFQVKVLNRTLTYQIDQILVVLPYETEALEITEGMDYCTLFTCTPYGINTHRMLLRGHRISNPEAEKIIASGSQEKAVFDITPYIPFIIIFIILLFIIIVAIILRPKKKKETDKEQTAKDEKTD